MVRRLLTQFGLTAVIMAFGAGAALADSTAVGTVVTTDTANTTVTSAPTATPPSNNQTPPTAGPTAPTASTTDPLVTLPDVTTPPGDTTTPDTATSQPTSPLGATSPTAGGGTHSVTPPPSGSTPPPTASLPSPTISQVSAATAFTGSRVIASLNRAESFSGFTSVPPAPPAAVDPNHAAPPPPPPAPVGLLNQLHILLISTLVPATHAAYAVTQAAASSHAGLTATAIILALAAMAYLGRSFPNATYAARLRHSGFLGGARSDVGGLYLLFATPREMSSMRAFAPI